MSGTIHVFDLLNRPPGDDPVGLCPVFGADRFLKQLAVKHLLGIDSGEAEFSVCQFEGATAQWADVADELSTRSLFGGDGPRVVLVDNGDPFVKRFRDSLEQLQESPPEGRLVLVVDSWAANTRLYKRCDKGGIQINCDPPAIKRGRSKQRDDAKIIKWLITRASVEYGFELPANGAPVLIELTECNFGRMDQELAKLALYASDEKLDPIAIREIVGGWPVQTMWQAIDAATDGNAGAALQLLDQLLRSGEHPLALLGQLAWSLRRFATVGELAQRDLRNGRRFDLNQSLKDAGVRAWGGELDQAGERLRQLGRKRVARINDWLLEADLALKRTHSRPERGRLVLEKLLTRMATDLADAK